MDTFLLMTLAAFSCFSVICDRTDRDFFVMDSFCNKKPLKGCSGGGDSIHEVMAYNLSDKTVELPPEYVETNGFFVRMNYLSMFMKVPKPRFRLRIKSGEPLPLLERDFNHTHCWTEIIVPLPHVKADSGQLEVRYTFTALPNAGDSFIAMVDYIGLFKTKDNITEVDPLKGRAAATNFTVKPHMPTPPRSIPWEEFETVDTMVKVAIVCLVTALTVETLFIICVVI